MIISHKHKFIFFKSRKTAGSSIQVALAEHRGEKDIITSQYRLGIDDNDHSSGLNMDKFYTNHPHPHLIPTKKFLGPEIWNSYFKFAFIRNPFDIAVSRYHWNMKGKQQNPNTSVSGFRQWVKGGNLFKEDSLHLYTCGEMGNVELDFVGHYETLQDDLDYICNCLNLPSTELPQLKAGFRDKTHYTEFYDDETKSIVENFYAKDFKTFNYSFNPDFKVKKPAPIITQHPDGNPNINGPSLIKVPDFVENKLGNYYLYFASHNGKSIKLAYSDNLKGPWEIYPEGTLQSHNTNCRTHIASPDVHIEDGKIIMYYHGDTTDGQYSFKAISEDGINFTTDNVKLGVFYFRVFDYLGETYAIAKNKNTDGIIYKKIGDNFEPQFNLIDNIRHTAVYVDGNTLYIFYSIVGEAPESLYVCKIVDWEVVDNFKLREPKYNWEGATRPLIPSKFGMSHNHVNQLRDPCIFKEDDKLYLLYSYGGESGIALGELETN